MSGGVHFHRRGDSPAHTPRQLPGDVRGFVNREAELQRLDAILTGAHGDPRMISVCVIAGTPGAGKTSLALRWAHQAQDRFPDGQLHVNLRGYDPGEPVAAEEALHRFLTALGVPPGAIPRDADAAAALYRSLLSDRRMLVLLDNAATVAQVRPLLPGKGRCLAIVTSRSRLSSLAVRDGAQRITLGTLAEPEAVALLRAVTEGRTADDADKLAELARLCARLPLALRIAGERAVSDPHAGLDDLIADLRDESVLWDALSTGDEADADAVRTVFAWSYRALPEDAARLFRLLGLHPGPTFGPHAAAALAGAPPRRTRQLLDTLVGAHLLDQPASHRYEFHDLLRAYATAQARQEEPPAERQAALRRVLDWYLHTADAAQEWLAPGGDRLPLDPPDEAVTPMAFRDYDQAVDWSEREHANFLPAVRAAEAAGLVPHTWRLAAVLWHAQAPSASGADWLPVGELGLRAARHLGDRPAEALLMERVGMGHARVGRLAESAECHREALAIRGELGDREGVAESTNLLGVVALRGRRLAEAERRFTEAMAVFTELGRERAATIARANLAVVRFQAGRPDEAEPDARAIEALHRERGDKARLGNILRLLSAIELETGRPEEALRTAAEAVEHALDLRDHTLEGYWLLALGAAQHATGLPGDALVSFQRSAVLHRRLGNRGREALAWQGAGEVYAALGRDEEAAAFLRRAAAAHRELRDRWNEALALEALGGPGDRERALTLIASDDDPRAAALRARLHAASRE
ncbi:tetratricopeptide repeat protein [Streptomyces radicis]|uniref:Tetratricopeptide repeat protein n=1 Tax=Streptomyces radicis TaxID=1750517 RepID=A0A3A9W9S5_9ACTN|nr:tetratricopeptide repeat protein [Streptomyces radicis]RKN23461.1 tetratricopeptide repeat protein [Streptomyces radicis]